MTEELVVKHFIVRDIPLEHESRRTFQNSLSFIITKFTKIQASHTMEFLI